MDLKRPSISHQVFSGTRYELGDKFPSDHNRIHLDFNGSVAAAIREPGGEGVEVSIGVDHSLPDCFRPVVITLDESAWQVFRNVFNRPFPGGKEEMQLERDENQRGTCFRCKEPDARFVAFTEDEEGLCEECATETENESRD